MGHCLVSADTASKPKVSRTLVCVTPCPWHHNQSSDVRDALVLVPVVLSNTLILVCLLVFVVQYRSPVVRHGATCFIEVVCVCVCL